MKKHSIVVVLATWLTFISGPLFSQQIVSPGENIQAALDKGDVKLSPGVHYIDKPLVVNNRTLEGSGLDETTITSTTWIHNGQPFSTRDKALIQLINGDLKNLSITSHGRMLASAVFATGNVWVSGIRVDGFNSFGIWADKIDGSNFEDIIIRRSSWASSAWAGKAFCISDVTNTIFNRLDIEATHGGGNAFGNLSGHSPSLIQNVVIKNSWFSVDPYGVWQDGKAPNISLEMFGCTIRQLDIINCFFDNHVSIVGNSNGQDNNSMPYTCRITGSDIISKGYGLEVSVDNFILENSYITYKIGYGIVNWEKSRQVGGWQIYNNVIEHNGTGWPSSVLKSEGGFGAIHFQHNTVDFQGIAGAIVAISGEKESGPIVMQDNIFSRSSPARDGTGYPEKDTPMYRYAGYAQHIVDTWERNVFSLFDSQGYGQTVAIQFGGGPKPFPYYATQLNQGASEVAPILAPVDTLENNFLPTIIFPKLHWIKIITHEK